MNTTEADGIHTINDYCYIIKMNDMYILDLYDETYSYLERYDDHIYHTNVKCLAYSDNEIEIDSDILEQFMLFVKSYKPIYKPTRIRLAYIYRRYKLECIANYNVLTRSLQYLNMI